MALSNRTDQKPKEISTESRGTCIVKFEDIANVINSDFTNKNSSDIVLKNVYLTSDEFRSEHVKKCCDLKGAQTPILYINPHLCAEDLRERNSCTDLFIKPLNFTFRLCYLYLLSLCLYSRCIMSIQRWTHQVQTWTRHAQSWMHQSRMHQSRTQQERTATMLRERSVRSRTVLTSFIIILTFLTPGSAAYSNEFEKTEQFMEKFNLEQNLAAIFNKVAYGGTTKRSIPENSYPVTTLATPLLTTYRYSDGNNEWLSVDVKKPESPRSGFDYDRPDDSIRREENYETNYGADLEKDHALPTSAPAADILKNNNNKNYENPNR